jgi:hypothetical protein
VAINTNATTFLRWPTTKRTAGCGCFTRFKGRCSSDSRWRPAARRPATYHTPFHCSNSCHSSCPLAPLCGPTHPKGLHIGSPGPLHTVHSPTDMLRMPSSSCMSFAPLNTSLPVGYPHPAGQQAPQVTSLGKDIPSTPTLLESMPSLVRWAIVFSPSGA